MIHFGVCFLQGFNSPDREALVKTSTHVSLYTLTEFCQPPSIDKHVNGGVEIQQNSNGCPRKKNMSNNLHTKVNVL